MANVTEMLIHGIMTPVIQLKGPAEEVEDPIRAEIAAMEAEESRDAALEAAKQAGDYVSQATRAATAAESSAVRAEAAIHKPPIIRDGMWWIWNDELGEYENSGATATGSDAGVTTENIKKALGYTPADEAKTVGVEPQVFTNAQKEQARKNIGAVGFGQLPDIVCTAQGEVISLPDASNRELKGLRIFGRTTQDGTPTPESPVDLVSVGASGAINTTVCGKNIVDVFHENMSVMRDGRTSNTKNTVNDDGSLIINVNGTVSYGQGFTKELFAGQTVTISYTVDSFGNGTGLRFRIYDINDYSTHKFDIKVTELGKYAYTFTPNIDSVYMFGWYVSGSSEVPCGAQIHDLQLEFSPVATVYEPFKDGGSVTAQTPNGLQGIPVASGGNYTDESGQMWVCDEIDFARSKYVKRIGIADKDIEWKYHNNGTNDFAYITPAGLGFSYTAFNKANDANSINCRNLKCNCLVYVEGGNTLSAGTFSIADFLYIKVEGFTSVTAYTDWMAENDFRLQYILEAPIETDLTAEEIEQYSALHTNHPNTTIYNDSDAGMRVAYVADTKMYIDNKFAQLAAAIVNNA